jgi:hypothetical protein
MPVSSALKAMRDSQWHLFSKWRGGVLLLNSAAWLLRADSGESYGTFKRLRAALAGSRGLDLRLLAAATLDLPPDRLEALRMELPDLEVAIKYRGGLALLNRFPQVAQSTKPVPLTPAMADVLLRASGWPDVSAFRFVRLYKTTPRGSNQTEVRFELYDRNISPLVMMSTKLTGH